MPWWPRRSRLSEIPARDIDEELAVIERQRQALRHEHGWREPDPADIPLTCDGHDHAGEARQ
jgi:hypothetical protein